MGLFKKVKKAVTVNNLSFFRGQGNASLKNSSTGFQRGHKSFTEATKSLSRGEFGLAIAQIVDSSQAGTFAIDPTGISQKVSDRINKPLGGIVGITQDPKTRIPIKEGDIKGPKAALFENPAIAAEKAAEEERLKRTRRRGNIVASNLGQLISQARITRNLTGQ